MKRKIVLQIILMSIIPCVSAQYSQKPLQSYSNHIFESQTHPHFPIYHYTSTPSSVGSNMASITFRDNPFGKIGEGIGDYLISETFYVGVVFLTAVLDWGTNGNPLYYYGTMVAGTFVSPLLVHGFGKERHPGGKYWHALLGSVISTVLWEAAIFFATPERATNQFMELSPLIVIPIMGLFPVLFYNILSRI